MPKCLKRYLDKSKAMRYRNRQRALNYELGNFSEELSEPPEPKEEKGQ